jgi:stage II sporulation protein D
VRGFLVIALLAAALAQAAGQVVPRSTLRVGLWTLWHDRELTLTPLAGATVRVCQNCAPQRLMPSTVRVGRDGLVWAADGQSGHATTELRLAGLFRLSAHGESLMFSDPLRVSERKGALELVATLAVERYVELAVAAESGPADSLESRKALAVVARSFALDSSHGHTGFDVCDSTHCQWVRWRSTAEAHEAALATAGESLWLHGHRTGAYFHQNCGGRTASAAELWPGRGGEGALISQPDPYCQRVESSEWSATLTRAQLTQALAAAGLVAPGWKTLVVAERGSSGRVMQLQLDRQRIPVESFRMAVGRSLGWNQVRSDWFEIAPEGDGYLLHGRGSGHGVGLCQAGAAEMAREGRGYREILTQYFPAAQPAEVSTGQPWQSFNEHGFLLETSDAADRAYLPALSHALAAAESVSGLSPRAVLTVRAYRSTPAFRDATLAPGWVAAFTEGDRIALQPLRTLAGRKLLEPVARHEFLHALVEAHATPATPLWLREGLVEAWATDPHAANGPSARTPFKPGSALTLEQVDQQLAHASTEAASEVAHQIAGWYAARLLERFGRAQVVDWLRAGPPHQALDSLR